MENGIGPEQLVRLLSSRDSILSLGTHKDSESEIKTYRLSNTSLSLKEIEEKIVKTVNEKNILLRDIATVILHRNPLRPSSKVMEKEV